MIKWSPSKEQKLGSISRTFYFFIDELNELQEELDCPDEFIYDLLEGINFLRRQTDALSEAPQCIEPLEPLLEWFMGIPS